jgi:hypothetical protein
MRKIFGGLLGIAAVLFLSLAYSQMAKAEAPDCKSQLANKIVELVNRDESGILKQQLRLTSYRLALATMQSRSKTVESYVAKQEAVFDAIDGKETVQAELIKLYRHYGEKGTEQTIVDRFQETLDKLPNGDYRRLNTRFKNIDLSAFTLAHQLTYGQESPFRIEDSAILWLQSEISEGVAQATRRGSAEANSQEVSTRILRLTGNMAGIEGKSEEELQKSIQDSEKAIDAELDRIVDVYRDELKKSCASIENCSDCKIDELEKRGAFAIAMGKIRDWIQADPDYRSDRLKDASGSLKKKGMELETTGGKVVSFKAPKLPSEKDLISAHRVPQGQGTSSSTPAQNRIAAPETNLRAQSDRNPSIPRPVGLMPELKLSPESGAQSPSAKLPLPGQTLRVAAPASLQGKALDAEIVRLKTAVSEETYRGMKPGAKPVVLGKLNLGDCESELSLVFDHMGSYSNQLVLSNPKNKKRATLRFNPPNTSREFQSAWNLAEVYGTYPEVKSVCGP